MRLRRDPPGENLPGFKPAPDQQSSTRPQAVMHAHVHQPGAVQRTRPSLEDGGRTSMTPDHNRAVLLCASQTQATQKDREIRL